MLSPWDEDTFISKTTFDICILAQNAWIDAVDQVVQHKTMAFALTRPPGHHALRADSMGFCIFNFAVGAAHYALDYLNIQRVGIIDFDAHYGNGVASMISNNKKIKYTSIHQSNAFPYSGTADVKGDFNNILNIPISAGTTYESYISLLKDQAIPFLKDFNPELVIVCAGYDALATDTLAELNLVPKDYESISRLIKDAFGPVMFGLEGGYDIKDLPKAVISTIKPYTRHFQE